MSTNNNTIARLDYGSALARVQVAALERNHPRAEHAAAMRARGRRDKPVAALHLRGLGSAPSSADANRVAEIRRVLAIEAQAKVKKIIETSSMQTSMPQGVAEARAMYGADFPGPSMPGRGTATPGASSSRLVRTADRRAMPPAIRSSVFGGSGIGGLGRAGLGDGCTSTGANIAQATIAAGATLSTSFASGDLSSRITTAGTTSISSKTGLPMVTSPTTSTTSTLSSGQKAALASSVILGLTSSIYTAVCAARGTTEAVQSAAVGSQATTSAIALVTAARNGTLATPAPGSTLPSTTSATAPSTTATGTAPGAAPTVSADNRTMLYVGGGIAAVALLGLFVLRK